MCQKQPIHAIESYATDVHFLSFIKYYYMKFAEAMGRKLSTFISSACVSARVCVCVWVGVFFLAIHIIKRDEIIIFIFYLIFSSEKREHCLLAFQRESGNFQVKQSRDVKAIDGKLIKWHLVGGNENCKPRHLSNGTHV